MNKFGGAAGGSLAEVFALEKKNIVAASSRIDGDSGPRGAAADDDDVPGIFARSDAGKHLVAVHRISLFQCSERLTASLQLSCRRCICFVLALGVKTASAARCFLSSSMPLQNPVASPAR